MTLRKRLTVLVLGCFLIGASFAVAQEQTSQPSDETTQQLRRELEEAKENTKQLSNAVQDLKAQNMALSKQLDWLTPIAAIITLVLLAGSGTSFVTLRTDRKRLKESYLSEKAQAPTLAEREKLMYERQDELYRLTLQKEQESSERDRSIFVQSTQTLTLVNATLKLAKEASERASKSLEEKLTKQHNELEAEAIELVDSSKAYKNFKVLVEDSRFRSTLQTLAGEITGLQNNQNILDKEVTLAPYCSFIRGMNYHLDQHVKPALKYWKSVKDHPGAPEALKIMALHWIGYEQNNLGDFEDAFSSFELAAALANGPLKYELERLKIESRFFWTDRFSSRAVLPEMEALHEKVKKEDQSEEFQKAKSSIAGTLGNIYLQVGDDISFDPLSSESPSTYYDKAKKVFENAPKKTKWTWFGYGEACSKLGDKDEAEACFLSKVQPEAELEYSTRLEPRTKVLGQTTVLICSMLMPGQHKNVISLYNLIKLTLGSVGNHVTVYSQFKRRNVHKKAFLEDLEKAVKEFGAIE
jgi:hypothetical protein